MFDFIKRFSVLLVVMSSASVFAQDIIILRDGTDIEAVVSEIGIQSIRYKMWTNQEGPDFLINISRVSSIRFQNGDIERFSATEPAQTPATAPVQQQQQVIQQPAVAPVVKAESVKSEPIKEKEPLKEEETAKRVYFGLRLGGGIGLSRPAGKYASEWRDYYMKESGSKFKSNGSFDVAPFVSIQFADAFAIQSEILFTRFGFGQRWEYEGEDGYYLISRGAMVIPLLAKLTIADRKVGIFAGPHLMPEIGQYKYSWKDGDESGSKKFDANTDGSKTQLIGLTFGADFGFNVGSGRLFFDARYLTSLGKPRKGDKWDDDRGDLYIRLAKLSLTVGYEFGAGSR